MTDEKLMQIATNLRAIADEIEAEITPQPKPEPKSTWQPQGWLPKLWHRIRR